MAAGRARRGFTITTKVAQEPMSERDIQAIERILARLIARAYVADHPDLFGLDGDSKGSESDSESPSTARAEVATPTTSEGDSDQSELGDDIARIGQLT